MKKMMLLMAAISGATSAMANPFFVGLKAIPEMQYRRFGDNAANKSLNSINKPSFWYSVGIVSGMDLTKKLELESGLLLQMAGYRTDELTLTDQTGKTIGTTRDNYRGLYLNLPVLVNYSFAQISKVKVYGTLGVVNGFKIAAETVTHNSLTDGGSNKKTETNTAFEGYRLSAMAGVGIAAQLSENLSARMAPSFQYDILPGLNRDAGLKGYLWSAGLSCSVIYKI